MEGRKGVSRGARCGGRDGFCEGNATALRPKIKN